MKAFLKLPPHSLYAVVSFLLLSFLFYFSSSSSGNTSEFIESSYGGGRRLFIETTSLSSHRKLIPHSALAMDQPNRLGEKCTTGDIVVNQGPTAPLPNGIPTFTVEIMNVGATGCDISAIHLNCGWFSSARLINPKVFKRLRYNDCLVNDGKPLVNGGSLSFQYANTFSYPLSVASVTC